MKSTPWTRADTLALLRVTLIAFALRFALVMITRVVGGDSQAYLSAAEDMINGVWHTWLSLGIHPAYPATIALAGTVFGNLLAGAYAVSVLFSSLAVGTLFILLRDMTSRRVAVLSSLFYACIPYFILVHADILTEALFQFFFITSASLAWFGATRSSLGCYLFAGITGAFAYLTRPEGISLLAAMGGITIMAMVADRLKRNPLLLRRLVFLSLALVLFLSITFPLLLWFRHATGSWTITKRASMEHLEKTFGSVPDDQKKEEPRGWARAFGLYVAKLAKVLMYGLLVFLVAGLFLMRDRIGALAAMYLGCLFGGYSLGPLAAAAGGYTLSQRHIMLPVVFILPIAAIGLVTLYDRLSIKWRSNRLRWAIVAVVGLFLTVITFRAVHPRRVRYVSVMQVVTWVKENSENQKMIYSNSRRVGAYLAVRPTMLSLTPETALALHLKDGELLLVNERRALRVNPSSLDQLNARFQRIARFPEKGIGDMETFSIFRAKKE